jgi:hypothetical protein
MSGSIEPSPPVTGRRRGFWLRFGLLVAISFIWIHGRSRRARGTERNGDSICCCPYCFERGDYLTGRLYRCKNKHEFTAEHAKLGKEMKENKEKEEKEKEKEKDRE